MIPAAGFNPHKSSPSTADFVRNLIVITFISLVFSANAIGQNIISTFAGTSWTFPSSVKTALSAPLGTIAGVATDPQGNVYAADTGNNLVFRIGTDGSIKIVAGNGTPGFSGDGGPATSASLYEPSALTLDPAGNLYIADAGNNRIRQVTPAGIISTFAGNGTAVAGTEVTQPKSVAIIGPTGLASDSAGNIYIADTGGHRIRKVTAAGVQSTIAGTGTAGFSGDAGTATSAALSGPTDVVVDSTGNIYIADNGNYRIRKINAGGIISTIAGTAYFYPYLNDGGSATSTTLFDPIAIALDSFGNLYIADQAIDRIRKVTSAGVISSVAGNLTTGFSGDGGSGLSASLNAPDSLAVDPAGNLIIADSGNERIRSLSTLGVITTIAGSGNFQYSGDGGPGISANLNFPESVAVDSGGNVFVADNLNNRIRKISPAGTITTVAGTGIPGYSGDNGLALSAALLHPASVAFDNSGTLYVTDEGNSRVRKIYNGSIYNVAGNGRADFTGDGSLAINAALDAPQAAAPDALGNVLIADFGNNRIRKVISIGTISTISGNGDRTSTGDGGPLNAATYAGPACVAFDAAGNLYVCDFGGNKIRKLGTNGTVTTVAGTGKAAFSGDGGQATAAALNGPSGLAIGPDGSLYIADTLNSRIRVVSPSGIISTFAGNGTPSFSGDTGAATQAALYLPSSVALDAAGNLYIADTGNNRIRKVTLGPKVQTITFNTLQPVTFTAAPITLTAASSAGLAITYTSNTPLVCQVNGVSLTLLAAGTCSVTAAQPGNSSYAPAISVTQTFTVNPGTGGPAISANGIAPVYSTATTIQPGSWISIYGTNLATSTVSWNGDFPTTLGGTTVTINGKKAYLWFVSPAQINLQAPDDTTIGTVPVVVTTAAGTYVSSVKLAPTAPSFSLLDGKHVTGIILRQDGSGTYGGGTYDILGPTGSSLGYKTTAAKAGDSVVLFAVGLGPTTPPVPAGQAFTSAAPTASSVQIVVNAMLITPAFSGLTSAGLYQLNITIPPGLPTGDVPLAALTGGLQTQSGVVISLQ